MSKVALLRILLVLALLAPAAVGAALPQCPAMLLNATYQLPRQASSEEAIREIKESFDSDFAQLTLGRRWLRTPRRAPMVQRLVENLTALTPEQRDQVSVWLQKDPPADSTLKTIMEVALYQKKAWMK